ncbi:MAG TPA: WD40 repeat domain-containing protein [Pirellulales bacterium]|nr:WD40 repeat domain-containing protein [Pirellulales bacterium]
MARRFTLAGLLFWVTFAALGLAIVVPIYRRTHRLAARQDMVVSLAVSADGSTCGALMGDGKVLIWDTSGMFKATLRTRGSFGLAGQLALSPDGKQAVVTRGWQRKGNRPRRGIDLWDVGAVKVLKTIPAATLGAQIAFSPRQHLLLVQDRRRGTAIHSLDNDRPPRTIASEGLRAKFSPDGTVLAVTTGANELKVYDAATLALVAQTDVGGDECWCQDMAWSPDGQTIAILRGTSEDVDDSNTTIETWQWKSGQRETKTLPDDAAFAALTFVADGRTLAVAGSRTGLVHGGGRFEPLSMGPTLHLAADVRGESLLTEGVGRIDLWDGGTFRLRKRLFEKMPEPPLWPALAGMTIWLIVFALRRARKKVRLRFEQAKTLTPGSQRKKKRASVVGYFMALMLGFVLMVVVRSGNGAKLREVAPLPLGVLAGSIALGIGIVYARLRWKLARAANPARDFAIAERAAGTQGTTRQIGDMLTWSAPGTSLVEMLEREAEAARDRLRSVVGLSPPPPTVRTFFFEDGQALASYLAGLGIQLAPHFLSKSVYLRAPGRRLLVAESPLRQHSADPRVTLRWLLTYHLLESLDGRSPAAWIDQGLAAALSHDNEYHELARLQRRVLAGRASGRTIGAGEFLAGTVNRNWRKHLRHNDLKHFAWSQQFAAQTWSVMEFLCGRGATPERRLAFQRFFNDPDRRKRPAEAFARHFDCPFEELLNRWQTWVDEQGTGEHYPPPAHLATYLMEGPIARLASTDTLPGERVTAIRELGEHGYLLGADRLIALLDGHDEELRREAVWSQEWISGQSLGSAIANWQAWWQGVAETTSYPTATS